ncbi:MAG: PAS domain S-box protein [Opitutaceae bacterium]|nr:PAS domain S-box protein [Opitutaceae bacterium]
MPYSRHSPRLGFQTKVLVPVVALLILLPALTLWIVDRHIGRQMEEEASTTLSTAEAVFRQSLAIRHRSLVSRFRNAVNEPRFRAVAGLGDVKTMSAFLSEALAEFGEETEFVTFSDAAGEAAGGAARTQSLPLDAVARAAQAITQRALEGESAVGSIYLNRHIYDVVAVPVIASDRSLLRGVLTVAVRFGEQVVSELKTLTHTEIAVLANGRVTVATLPQKDLAVTLGQAIADGRNPRVRRERIPVVVEGEHFLALNGELRNEGTGPGLRYVLLSSYEARLQALKDTRTNLIGLSASGILIGVVLISFIVRRITRPLVKLRDGAEAVGRGDFSLRIRDVSNDECGDLAVAFNRMIGNLDSSRTELESTVGALRSTDAQLRESREELRLMIESARDHMILSFDAEGHVVSWNPAAGRLLGYSAAEAQGMVYGLLFSATDRAAGVPEEILRKATAEGRHAFEGLRVRRDGTMFWADVTVSRLPDTAASGRGGFVEIARDITARKEAELALNQARDAAEAANRAKSEFLANISHELRTPMNAIIGMSSLLQDRLAQAEDAECTRTIQTSAASLLETIDDILDISKMESGQIELSPRPFDVLACVEGVVDTFAERCRVKGVEIGAFVSADLPGMILADERRLRQVLSALVANAVKFTPQGNIAITVTYLPDEHAPRLEFAVEDTGIGIAPQQREGLFKSFSQVESSASRRFGGLGLGLAIAHHVVTLMRGNLRVESELGRGSCFTVSVPIPPPHTRSTQFTSLAGTRILIVKTNGLPHPALARQLAVWGAAAESITGGVTGVHRWFAQGGRCDLVLHVAGGSGEISAEQLFETLKERAPSQGCQVLQLTAPGVKPAATPLFTRTCPRPLKPRSFHAALRQVLDPKLVGPDHRPLASGANATGLPPLRILLVEDNPVNSRVALLLLKRIGYAADCVVNGRLGLERMRTHEYDLVLMDLQMPEMDGLEATRLFRAEVGSDQRPYICGVTANALKEDQDACFAVGMHQFMAKPVQLDKLTALIAEVGIWLRSTASSPGAPIVPTSRET